MQLRSIIAASVIVVISLILLTCSRSKTVKNEALREKSDVRLLQLMKKAAANESIPFSAICQQNLSEANVQTIAGLGIQIQTKIGNIFTARGRRDQIVQLANQPFILRLEGAKPLKPRK